MMDYSTSKRLAILLFIGTVMLTGISTMGGPYWWISAVAALILYIPIFPLIAVTDFKDEVQEAEK